MRRVLLLVGLLAALAGPAAPHALQPGFLDLQFLRGFLEIVGENEPVAANHFLRQKGRL